MYRTCNIFSDDSHHFDNLRHNNKAYCARWIEAHCWIIRNESDETGISFCQLLPPKISIRLRDYSMNFGRSASLASSHIFLTKHNGIVLHFSIVEMRL